MKKSDHAIERVNGYAISVSVRKRRGNDRPHRRIGDAADSSQDFTNLPRFESELVRVIDVLVSAAAATAEVWTWRRDALRRSLDQIVQLGFRELLFLARDARGHAFALDRVRDENSLAIFARDAFTAKGDVLDC